MPERGGFAARGRPTTADDLARTIEEGILAGRWEPGVKLESERQLAEAYGVGRPMVREALKRLEERGLIDIQSARGSFVREYHPFQETAATDVTGRRARVTARDLMRARQMLEGEAAAEAAENRTDAQAREMTDILRVFDAGGDVDAMADLDMAFHEAIVVASGNAALQLMFGAIRGMTKGLMLRSLTDRAVSKVGAPIHHTILDAILARDPEAARAGMVAHLKIAESHYGADLDEPLADVLRRRAERLPAAADALRAASARLDEPDRGEGLNP